MPLSLSQTSRFGTAPSCSDSSDHIPASRSGVIRDGNMRAVMNRENAGTITSTGGEPTYPDPSGVAAGENHRSHCI